MTQPPPADPDEELRILIQRLSRRIRAERADHVPDAQLSVLVHLHQHGPSTPSRLAELDRVTPPSMNRTVNQLEEQGRVARTPDPDDGRRVVVHLTDAGRAFVDETRRLRRAWFTRQLDALAPQERRLLEEVTPILRRLADS
jgi:DNA-binding MarR family transcriptional regulator